MAKVIDLEIYREKTQVFNNREHAGELLALMLTQYRNDSSSIVVAIPAGGVPIAYVLSKRLSLPLEIAVTRKLHVPWNPEAGFGAITWNGLIEINKHLVNQLGLSCNKIEEVIEEEKRIIEHRRKIYKNQEFPNLKERHIIIVDDGLASGFSMLTTARAVRKYNPEMITVAVPTAPLRSIDRISPYVDQIICLNIRTGFHFAVASAYINWHDLSDDEVMKYLAKSKNL
jgi:predicted phosphoribosyltransferase